VSSIDNLRKAAKRWLKALRDGDAEARMRLARAYPDAPEPPTLRDVQHALARERGHDSWIALTKAVANRAQPEMPLIVLLDAAGKGNATKVAAILDEHPDLINQRGTLPANTGLRTALHFGVGHEAVVKTLLDRGADPNIRLIAAGAAITLPAAIALQQPDEIERVVLANPEIPKAVSISGSAVLAVFVAMRQIARADTVEGASAMREHVGFLLVNKPPS
jgi:hypothetical protein